MTQLQERLAEVMRATGWKHADLMRISRQSSSVVSQWLGNGSKVIKTIGKIEAALYIERESGFSALWVAKGILPKMARPAASTHRLNAQESGPPYFAPQQVLTDLEKLLREVPSNMRHAFADVLAGWARCGGEEDAKPALLALLGPHGKPGERAA